MSDAVIIDAVRTPLGKGRRGGALAAPVHCPDSVDVHDSVRDVCEQFRRVEPPERLLRDEQRLPDHRRRVLHLLNLDLR